MELLDADAAKRWLSERGLAFDCYSFSVVPKCSTPEGVLIRVGTTMAPRRLRRLMRTVHISGLTHLEFPSGEILKFQSHDTLVLLHDCDPDWNDDPAYVRAMQMLSRGCIGETKDPFGARGLAFSANEPVELAAFVMVPLYAGWEAYVVPAHGKYFTLFRYDYMYVVASRQSDVADVIASLEWAKFQYWAGPINRPSFLLDKFARK